MSNLVTDEDLAAAEARTAARKVLTDELDRLIAARDHARQEALIVLTVAVDYECAAGLHRKTSTGYDPVRRPPREALRNVDRALAAWRTATVEPQAAIDAKLAEIEQTNPQYRADMDLVSRWLRQH